MSAADVANLSEHIVAMLRSPTWVAPIANFVDEHCQIFEDVDENKLEYTMIHNAFKHLVDDLLAIHLVEMGVTTDHFLLFCSNGLTGGNEFHRSLVEQLISVDDFLVFKAMMVKRSAELGREATSAPAASDEATEVENLKREAERLEMERKCLEAELQLMVALSMQIEQRMHLTQMLNELVDAVAKMEAIATEAAACDDDVGAAQFAAAQLGGSLSDLPTPTCPQNLAPVLAPTVRVQPLVADGFAASNPPPAAPVPAPVAPAPVPVQRAGPTEEERRARAEHLRQQRELLVAKKKQERESQLAAHQQAYGLTAASRAAEQACSRTGQALQVQAPENDAGKKLAEELRGLGATPAANALPDPDAAAVEMRRTLARQLRQTLTGSLAAAA